jgi:DNA repair protein RadB
MGGPGILEPFLSKEAPSQIPLGFGVDRILGGGVETKTITQLYGPPGVGKTNFCLQAAVNCVRGGRKAIFIDTEGGYSAERMKQIAQEDYPLILENVLFYEPTNFEDQNFLVEHLDRVLDERFGLVVLDSAVSLYRIGSEEEKVSLTNRQLSRQLALLSEVSRKFNLAVLITNQVYTSFETDAVEPTGGQILKYWSKVTLEMKRKNSSVREIVLRRHKHLPDDLSVRFTITPEGLRDA